MRTGTILECVFFSEARMPAYKLKIDFGSYGILHSSAQITANYTPQDLVGTCIAALTGIPPKRIAGFKSECLVLAATDEARGTILLRPEQPVANGTLIS